MGGWLGAELGLGQVRAGPSEWVWCDLPHLPLRALSLLRESKRSLGWMEMMFSYGNILYSLGWAVQWHEVRWGHKGKQKSLHWRIYSLKERALDSLQGKKTPLGDISQDMFEKDFQDIMAHNSNMQENLRLLLVLTLWEPCSTDCAGQIVQGTTSASCETLLELTDGVCGSQCWTFWGFLPISPQWEMCQRQGPWNVPINQPKPPNLLYFQVL